MSRLQDIFKQKSSRVLNVYCTAGYPELNSTLTVMNALQENGADIIELGMPYSDPLADGDVIQASSAVALKNGMTIPELFSQLKNCRPAIKPAIILMGYMNPVLQFGFEKFCEQAATAGVDGLIIPDLPIYEFETEYGAIVKKHGLDFIFLITPETGEERIRRIDSLSSGFIYAVSSSSTTGNNKDIGDQEAYFRKLQSLQLNNPVLVGFGIKDKASFDAACRYSNGAIIGSAYIKALGQGGSISENTKQFLKDILG